MEKMEARLKKLIESSRRNPAYLADLLDCLKKYMQANKEFNETLEAENLELTYYLAKVLEEFDSYKSQVRMRLYALKITDTQFFSFDIGKQLKDFNHFKKHRYMIKGIFKASNKSQ